MGVREKLGSHVGLFVMIQKLFIIKIKRCVYVCVSFVIFNHVYFFSLGMGNGSSEGNSKRYDLLFFQLFHFIFFIFIMSFVYLFSFVVLIEVFLGLFMYFFYFSFFHFVHLFLVGLFETEPQGEIAYGEVTSVYGHKDFFCSEIEKERPKGTENTYCLHIKVHFFIFFFVLFYCFHLVVIYVLLYILFLLKRFFSFLYSCFFLIFSFTQTSFGRTYNLIGFPSLELTQSWVKILTQVIRTHNVMRGILFLCFLSKEMTQCYKNSFIPFCFLLKKKKET
jgi:hypothetical protein